MSGRPQSPGGETAVAAARGELSSEVERALQMYRTMCLVREVEGRIESMHKRGRVSGSFHSSLGQEACAVGVCSALRPDDMVTSTHRGHGHAIAKGAPVDGVVAELFGRAGGVSGGRGGSMHLHHRPSGFLGQNAIVGGGLPWAAGAAWARRRRGADDVAVAFTGDGGIAQGAFHETLTLARCWSSPLLIVCENNGLAHSMPVEQVFGAPGKIAEMVAATGVESRFVDGRDVRAVRAAAEEMLALVRAGRPGFIECEVFRVRPHSISDPDYRYREKRAGEAWMEDNDPLAMERSRLREEAPERLAEIDEEVDAIVTAAITAAESAEPTPAANARRNVYASEELQSRV